MSLAIWLPCNACGVAATYQCVSLPYFRTFSSILRMTSIGEQCGKMHWPLKTDEGHKVQGRVLMTNVACGCGYYRLLDRADKASYAEVEAGRIGLRDVLISHKYAKPLRVDITLEMAGMLAPPQGPANP